MSFVLSEDVDFLHVEAQAEVALLSLDPEAARALSVLELAERQGAELGAEPMGEPVLVKDKGLPPASLSMVEVLPPQFPIGKQDILLLHEHKGVKPTVAGRNGYRGIKDIFHGTAGNDRNCWLM